MRTSRSPLIAREGWPFIATLGLLVIWSASAQNLVLAAFSLPLMVLAVLVFRDPARDIPAEPRAVLSPVDGRVTAVEYTDRGCLEREATRISIRIDNFGAYTVRAPVEGKVYNLQDNFAAGSRLLGMSGLWLHTDEADDVVLLMDGPRLFGRPAALVGYGQRLGQGQRCAYVRLATRAQVFLPLRCGIKVSRGDRVRAGSDVLAMLIHG